LPVVDPIQHPAARDRGRSAGRRPREQLCEPKG